MLRRSGLSMFVVAMAAIVSLVAMLPSSAQAENYFFAPAPQQDLNRVYRVDRLTGEVTACQFAIKDGDAVGVTLCYPAADGAKAGEAGDYLLVPSSHRQEAGIFRVNRRSGEVSICYVRGDQEVVCTPPAR